MALIKVGRNNFDVNIKKSFFSHLFGLMFSFSKNDGVLMIFKKEKNISLHSFFVFIKFDIVYFDDSKSAIKIIKNVKQFTPYIRNIKCRYILEVKDCKNVKLNDKLSIEE